MTKEEFSVQVSRLSVTHKDKYKPEVVKVLWERYASTPGEIFKHAIDRALAVYLKPPMANELDECITKVRNEFYDNKRIEYKKAAEEFFHPVDEEVSLKVSTIIGRLTGQVGDKEYEEFKSVLAFSALREKQVNKNICSTCMNDGVLIDEKNFAWRCRCHIGQSRKEAIPLAR